MTDPPIPVSVAGSGLVGSSFALFLARAGVPLQLFDARGEAPMPAPSQLRPIALAAASVRILDRLGAWDAIASRAQPIASVHVSERGRFGRVRMSAAEHGLDALGYVTDAASIEAALNQALRQQPGVERVLASPVIGARSYPQTIQPQLAGERQPPPARLLVVADGAESGLGDSLGLRSARRDYAQQAIVCNVALDGAHGGVAYERFLDSGPLALLPLADGRCGLVWTLPDHMAPAMAGLAETDFLAALTESFGHRLGRFTGASERQCFGLSRISVIGPHGHRSVCIGNAANQLHPVAGQGLNLGLRDAATLAELVIEAHARGGDAGEDALLERYARARRADHRRVVAFTDLLARGFTSGPRWIGHLRSLALLAVQLMPPARIALARGAMGLRVPLPRAASRLEP